MVTRYSGYLFLETGIGVGIYERVYIETFLLTVVDSAQRVLWRVPMLHGIDGWLSAVRPVVEMLYFASAIALAAFAFKGLEQLKISREIARTNARREAFKLAAEQCRYFAETVVPLSNKRFAECTKLNLASFADPKFEIVNGEIVSHDFSTPSLMADFQKCHFEVMSFLNSIEAFSVFFASGVADESVAYRETGTTFCATMKRFMPAVYLYRLHNVRYESTVKLYEIWSARAASEALLKTRESIDTRLTKLKKESIKPIGTVIGDS